MKINKTFFKSAVLMIMLEMLSSCANPAVSDASNIQQNSSKEQVSKLLGQPQNRQFRGKQEAWQYCQTEFVNDAFVLVWFYEDKVTGVTTYRDSTASLGLCSSHFKTVNWEQAPNTIKN